MRLWVCALQPAEEAEVRIWIDQGSRERSGVGPYSLGPHPWPVHSRSSAIQEFSCCSSPTSKMMSVRSFTWQGEREWLCGCLGCVGVTPGWEKPLITFRTKV